MNTVLRTLEKTLQMFQTFIEAQDIFPLLPSSHLSLLHLKFLQNSGAFFHLHLHFCHPSSKLLHPNLQAGNFFHLDFQEGHTSQWLHQALHPLLKAPQSPTQICEAILIVKNVALHFFHFVSHFTHLKPELVQVLLQGPPLLLQPSQCPLKLLTPLPNCPKCVLEIGPCGLHDLCEVGHCLQPFPLLLDDCP